MTVAHPGPLLQATRLQRQETLQAAAAVTGLPRKVLDALESGRSRALLGDLAHRGYLRIYARHLGLDAEDILRGLGPQAARADVGRDGHLADPRRPSLSAWLDRRRSAT